jgi:low affinity Fe/Cu permease
LNDAFRKFAHGISAVVGAPGSFFTAAAVIVAWALTGPFFLHSDTWQ